jgi:hypothetical protein
MRSFSTFTFDVVEKIFNIKEVRELSLLTEWLSATYLPNEHISYQLNKLKDHLLQKAVIWQEDEFKMFFIGPLIEAAEIGNDIFQPFTQRMFSITHNGEEIGGKVDFMIAKGRRVPELPYFCIHEYKQEADSSGEPIGQLLIAMVAAQLLNETKHPILGAYVIGRSWFFVVLDGNKYAKSMLYDATSEDIFQIFAILQKSKEIIQRFV